MSSVGLIAIVYFESYVSNRDVDNGANDIEQKTVTGREEWRSQRRNAISEDNGSRSDIPRA